MSVPVSRVCFQKYSNDFANLDNIWGTRSCWGWRIEYVYPFTYYAPKCFLPLFSFRWCSSFITPLFFPLRLRGEPPARAAIIPLAPVLELWRRTDEGGLLPTLAGTQTQWGTFRIGFVGMGWGRPRHSVTLAYRNALLYKSLAYWNLVSPHFKMDANAACNNPSGVVSAKCQDGKPIARSSLRRQKKRTICHSQRPFHRAGVF